MYNYLRFIHISLILCIALLFTRQSFGQYRLIQTFSESGSFGSQVSGIGNVNGDDYDDIIVLGQDEHKAYIYYGGDPMGNIADVILNDVYSVSGAGDVDGDGYDDVIAGDWSSYCAYLYYGSNQMDNTVDLTFEPAGGTYNFGSSVAGVGDVNNDSYDDIIIGDDGYTGWLNDNDILEVGRAIIYFGGGPEMDNSPDITMYGEIEYSNFGFSVSGAGDFNNDNYDDVIVGAPGYGDHSAGRAYIFYGGDSKDSSPDLIMEGVNYYKLGTSVSGAGDVNYDGIEDVIVGMPGYYPPNTYPAGQGRVDIYYGAEQSNTSPYVISSNVEIIGDTNAYLGKSISGAGNVNNDNFDDIIIGESTYNSNTGRVYIYFGGSPMDKNPDVTLYGEIAYSNFGVSVSGAGDVNNDGKDEVIVGADGKAYVYSINICEGDYTLTSQEEVDEFSSFGCDRITGNLTITGSYITNLDGLSELKSIGGDLTFYANERLTNISGLSELTSIEGNLFIKNNPGLLNIDGLSNLISVGQNLLIFSNTNLNDIKGLSGLTSIGASLEIDPNPRLINIDGLSSLESVGVSVRISNNDKLEDIGLSALNSVGNSLSIFRNNSLTNIDGLSSLMEVGGDLSLYNNPNLSRCCGLYHLLAFGTVGGSKDIRDNGSGCTEADILAFCNCEGDIYLDSQADVDNFPSIGCSEIGGRLIVTGSDITNLNGLSNLSSVGGNFIIETASGVLTNLNGLSNLKSIGGNLEINRNIKLKNLEGFSGLTSIGGSLLFYENDELINITGLSGLTSIGLSLVFEDNKELTNIKGLSNLTSIGADLWMGANDKLINLEGLSGLISVGASLTIDANNALPNIDALSHLTSVGGDLSVAGNRNLTKCCGLYPLLKFGTIGGSRDIRDNGGGCTEEDILAGGYCNCDGDIYLYSQEEVDKFALLGCSEIGGNLTIQGADITDLSGLSILTSVGGNLIIVYNDILENLGGLSGLTSVEGNVTIRRHHVLKNLDGLSGLTSVGGYLRIEFNSDLTSIDGLAGLTSVPGEMSISHNLQLTNIDGLSSLMEVGGDLYIDYNPLLTNLDSLSSLNSIGGMLEIWGNDLLENINGLSALHSNIYSLDIRINPKLMNINGLLSLSEVGAAGVVIINNDALANVNGLSSLARVEGSVEIADNEILENIDGLFSLVEVGKNLEIRNNSNLARCCGLFPLLKFGEVGGEKIFYCNPVGCTEADILAQGYCNCDGDIELNSQAQVDHFNTTGCTELKGSLTIQGLNITNIDALSFLTSIGGDLVIINNPLLTNLDGFINLTSIGGNTDIENNPVLTDIDGLSVSSLSSIGKDLKINNNITLTNLNGLSELTYVGGDIFLTNNPLLTDFSGLYPVLNIGGVAGSITIEGNGTNPAATEILFVGLNERIEQFYSSGLLDEGQSTALIIRLEQATQKLNRGKTKTAINILNSIINQVNSFIAEGILTEAEGQELLSAVNEIINQINAEKGLLKKGNGNITEKIQTVIPENYSLAQNYPNPFNPITTIVYGLPEDASVVLKIFNVLGAEVMQSTEGFKNAGYHKVSFNASHLPSGIYFYRLQAGSFIETKKMILLK